MKPVSATSISLELLSAKQGRTSLSLSDLSIIEETSSIKLRLCAMNESSLSYLKATATDVPVI